MIEIDATFLLACGILLVAAVVSGLAGFGFSIVSIPPLLLLYDPGTAIAVNKILTIGTTWIVVVEAWRHISWRWIARLLPTALVGLVIGGWLLTVLDADVIKVIAGAIVVVLAVLLLTWQPHRLRERGWMAPAIGLVSGTSSTATGMAGPPLVLAFTVLGMSKETFRATAAAYFVTSDLIGLPTLMGQGAVTGDDLRLAVALAPVAVIGRLLGIRLVRHVSPLAFRRATLVLLLLTGSVSVVTGLVGLGW
jgi:uncharacterized membrane protein YfcA